MSVTHGPEYQDTGLYRSNSSTAVMENDTVHFCVWLHIKLEKKEFTEMIYLYKWSTYEKIF